MPLMRYFVFVGGALLALLFIADAWLPTPPLAQSSQRPTDLSIIRIHSDRKWPERVVFDTTLPTITPAPMPAAPVFAEAPANAAPASAAAEPAAPRKGGSAREAFAQAQTNPAHLEPKRKRKSVARIYVSPPRIQVAQQRPFFFFGNNIW